MESYYKHEDYDRSAKEIHICKLLCDRILENEYDLMSYKRIIKDHVYSEDDRISKEDLKKIYKYDNYMRKQDREMLFGIIKRKGDRWWI